MSKPRILLYDLETSPGLGYAWGKYEQTVLKFVNHREIMSVGYKWLGEDRVTCVTRQGDRTDKALAQLLHDLFSEADIIIAHNGNKFDKKVAKTRMIIHGLKPVKHLVTVDTCVAARSYFDFNGNSLNDLASFFKIGGKVTHEGLSLWFACMKNNYKGSKASWAKMAKYNKHDVTLLEAVYKILRPWIENHPNVARIMNASNSEDCHNCGSANVHKNGIRPTIAGVQQRWACKDCGKPFLTRYKAE